MTEPTAASERTPVWINGPDKKGPCYLNAHVHVDQLKARDERIAVLLAELDILQSEKSELRDEIVRVLDSRERIKGERDALQAQVTELEHEIELIHMDAAGACI